MPIALNGSTSGKVTVQAAATAANNTLTLPSGNGMLVGQSTTTAPTNGQIPIGNGTDYTPATITAGTGISVTNGAGSITIASSASGTVTSVATGTGLTGGTITTSGTISLVTTAGAVGTYGFFSNITSPNIINFGGTTSGSNLKPAGFGLPFNTANINASSPLSSLQNSAQSGTWQCMGYAPTSSTCGIPYYNATLWIRIA